MSSATPPLEDFRDAYDADDNLWWMIGCGHHRNLFDAACEEIDRLRGAIERVRAIHRSDGYSQPTCRDCGREWPCSAITALSSRPVPPEGEQR